MNEEASNSNLRAARYFMNRITDRILEKGKRMGFGVQHVPRCGYMIGLRPIEGNGGYELFDPLATEAYSIPN